MSGVLSRLQPPPAMQTPACARASALAPANANAFAPAHARHPYACPAVFADALYGRSEEQHARSQVCPRVPLVSAMPPCGQGPGEAHSPMPVPPYRAPSGLGAGSLLPPAQKSGNSGVFGPAPARAPSAVVHCLWVSGVKSYPGGYCRLQMPEAGTWRQGDSGWA